MGTAGKAGEATALIVKPRKRLLPDGPAPAGLTQDELSILYWLSQGKTCVEIAMILEKKRNAVYQTMHRTLLKLGCATATSAVATALRRNIIE